MQSASDGVDGLLFPELASSDVVVTNARGVFDDPIAEWAIGAMVAFTTGLQTSIVDQTQPVVGPTGAVATAVAGRTWSWSARVRSAAPRLSVRGPSG